MLGLAIGRPKNDRRTARLLFYLSSAFKLCPEKARTRRL
jgi:hypothetical protein